MLILESTDGLTRCAPNTPLFRIGRRPSPWLSPDWSRANKDGTFGNRFDDPIGYYRVLYASTQRLSCFIETLARYRADLSFLADLSEIEGEDDFVALGNVPLEWLHSRIMGTARVSGVYADIYSSGWVSYLRQELAKPVHDLGYDDLDLAVLQTAEPRLITQRASRAVFAKSLDGIYYRSRHGHDLDNWALFEPYRIESTSIEPDLSIQDQDLQAAMTIHNLVFS